MSTATDINAAGPILSRGPVARRDRIVDSTLHCIRSKARSQQPFATGTLGSF